MDPNEIIIEPVPTIVATDARYEQQHYHPHMPELGKAPIWHLDGISWSATPPPPRRHRHWAQTVGYAALDEVWRCPCAAYGGPLEPWVSLGERRVARRSRWWRRFLPGGDT